MFIDCPTEAGLSTLESHRPATVSNHWFIRAGCSPPAEADDVFIARCTKGIVHARKPDADESYMALTFGTLLSSQGADAHRQDPSGPIGGNPRYFTRSVPHGQTRPALPGLPLGRGARRVFVPRAWGNIRPAPLAGLASRLDPRLAAPSREQGEH
jgi:hypothetical protein